jgi:hypothetical protein
MADRFYIEEMRQRLGLEKGDTRRDAEIERMSPYQRFGLLCGWFLGNGSWASTVLEWAKDAGLSVTADAVSDDEK